MRHRLVIFIALLAWHCCGSGVACHSAVQTINSYFDPAADFLELGVSYGAKTEWKLYGPDLSGQYGGINGIGGLDAVSPELSLFNPVATDVRGDILGYYDSSGGEVVWNAVRTTGYGAVPNYRPVALTSGVDLEQSSSWRGLWPDITGYYNIGLRPYDPVSGRWLTYDSAWNGTDPNYYSFAGGDPINHFDSDGRFSTQYYYGQGLNLTIVSPFVQNAYQPNQTIKTWIAQRDAEGNWTFSWGGADYSFGGQQSSSFISDVSDSILNTQQRDDAWNALTNPDFSSGWGVATWADAGVSYVANTVDAAANMVPIVGTGKAIVENTVKAGIKSVANALAKDAARSGADVALGKGSAGLLDFADEVGAHSYHTWHDAGLISEPIGEANFAVPFDEATSAAGNIRFNLDGVDIEAALNMDPSLAESSNPIMHPGIGGQGQITEWELRQVLSDENLFNKINVCSATG